jgi:hypothetical protein
MERRQWAPDTSTGVSGPVRFDWSAKELRILPQMRMKRQSMGANSVPPRHANIAVWPALVAY